MASKSFQILRFFSLFRHLLLLRSVIRRSVMWQTDSAEEARNRDGMRDPETQRPPHRLEWIMLMSSMWRVAPQGQGVSGLESSSKTSYFWVETSPSCLTLVTKVHFLTSSDIWSCGSWNPLFIVTDPRLWGCEGFAPLSRVDRQTIGTITDIVETKSR